MAKTSNKISLTFKSDNFDLFSSKIEDLCKISDTIKVKIDNENILMYSLMGTENIILAFKSFDIKTKDIFLDFDTEFTVNIIITSAKKFFKNLFFIKKTEKILMDITYKMDDDPDSVDARIVQIKNSKFKLQIQTGENSEIRDLNKKILEQRLDFKNKLWDFTISNKDFLDIKKLSSINMDDSRRILHLNIENRVVKLSETSLWELEVDSSNEIDKHLMFNKSLLSCINDNNEDVTFNVFDTFILIKDEISSLMISFEQDFSND